MTLSHGESCNKNEVGTYFKMSSSALSWRSLRQLPTFRCDICIHFQPEDESSRFFVTLETLISVCTMIEVTGSSKG